MLDGLLTWSLLLGNNFLSQNLRIQTCKLFMHIQEPHKLHNTTSSKNTAVKQMRNVPYYTDNHSGFNLLPKMKILPRILKLFNCINW